MKLFRHLAIAFSLYSRVPMPKFTWKEDDMAASLTFFPLVGVLIGAAAFGVNEAAAALQFPAAVRILLLLSLPVFLTGGIHIDGFMDTEDALHSYAPAEKKREILKDPHIGAFSVIALTKWMLLYAAAVAAILLSPKEGRTALLSLCLIFVLSRCCSGLCALLLQKAKKEGMLYEETKDTPKLPLAALTVQLIAVLCALVWLDAVFAGLLAALWICFTLFYRRLACKQFGGVTGDTAGFYLTVGEILSAVVLALRLYVL